MSVPDDAFESFYSSRPPKRRFGSVPEGYYLVEDVCRISSVNEFEAECILVDCGGQDYRKDGKVVKAAEASVVSRHLEEMGCISPGMSNYISRREVEDVFLIPVRSFVRWCKKCGIEFVHRERHGSVVLVITTEELRIVVSNMYRDKPEVALRVLSKLNDDIYK